MDITNHKNENRESVNGRTLQGVWNHPWFLMPVLLFFIIGLSLLMNMPHGSEIVRMNAWRDEPWNTLFRVITQFGEVQAWITAVLVTALFRYRFALLLAFAGLLTIPVSYYIKDVIGEDRPITYFEKTGQRNTLALVPGVKLNTGQTSFPSGHTTSAFNLFSLLAVFLPIKRQKWGLVLACMAIATGFSRIFLVQHFLGDVLAGAALGLLLAWLVLRLNRLLPAGWTWLDKGLAT